MENKTNMFSTDSKKKLRDQLQDLLKLYDEGAEFRDSSFTEDGEVVDVTLVYMQELSRCMSSVSAVSEYYKLMGLSNAEVHVDYERYREA